MDCTKKECKENNINWVKTLPSKPCPNSIYFLKTEGGTLMYVSSITGVLTQIGGGGGSNTSITSPDSSITVEQQGQSFELQVSQILQDLINGALQEGDDITTLINNAGYITQADLEGLQGVTDRGNVTNNNMTSFYQTNPLRYVKMFHGQPDYQTIDGNIDVGGGIEFSTSGKPALLSAPNLGSVRNLKLPDANGTLVSSVNGIAATTDGNVILPLADGFIPLSGTEVGEPVTGVIEFVSDGNGVLRSTSEFHNADIGFEQENIHFTLDRLEDGSSIAVSNIIFSPDGIYIDSNSTISKGIIGNRLFDIQDDENAYIQKGHLDAITGDFIPLSGTLSGNPVTGDIEMSETPRGIWIKGSDFPDNYYGYSFGEGSVAMYSQVLDNSISIGVNSQDVTINTNNPLSKGLVGNELYDKQDDPLAYVQYEDVTQLISEIPSITIDALPTPSSTNAVSSGGVVTYIDTQLSSVYKPAGDWNASSNTFPTSGTGTAGAVRRGDTYKVTVAGNPFGGPESLDVGDSFYAVVNNPGQTPSNWGKFETNTAQATESFRGTSRIATNVIALAGTDNVDYMTALKTRNLIDSRAFIQGGNSFGTTASVGTMDNNDVAIVRNNTPYMTFQTSDAYMFRANGILHNAGTSYSSIKFGASNGSTPLLITRNRNDAVTVFAIENQSVGSTGNLLDAKNTTTNVVAGIRNDGRVFGSNATVSNDFITLAQLPVVLSATATLDFPSTDSAMSSDLTVTVTGAAVGDVVSIGTPTHSASTCFTAFVSATNTVTIRYNNYSALAVNPASATFKVKVFK